MNIGLGTVQLGTDYGVTNAGGRVAPDEARRIITAACAAGVQVFDTAAAYGEAERLLGECLPRDGEARIVTRLPHLPRAITPSAVHTWAEAACTASLQRLGRDAVAALLVHRAGDLLGECGAQLYASLVALKQRGCTAAIGVSVYEADEIEALLDRYTLDLIQLPASLLDQRLIRDGWLQRLKQCNVEVHARSLLLQGLLATPQDRFLSGYFAPWQPLLQSFREAAAAEGLSPLQAAVGFATTVPELDCAVVGVTSRAELEEVLAAASVSLPAGWYRRFAVDDRRLLNPAVWPA